jgi:hypothetical protein
MGCEDCPLQAAYAQYVIEKDIQPEQVNYKEIFASLTILDGRRLAMMVLNTDIGRSYAIDATNCPGPRQSRVLLGLGRKACSAPTGYSKQHRQII